MLALQKYQNKKIAIYGMGLTGRSAAKILRKSKSKILCWDDSEKTRKKLKKLNFPIRKFWNDRNLVDIILISPGIDINQSKISGFLKRNTEKIITDLDLFFELNKSRLIISITGTNGKSTTCKIIEKILKTANLKVKTIGNIGKPVLSTNFSDKKNIFILEASSYQLQYSKLFRSKHAAILNISPDHIERHKNIKNYIKVKTKIFLAQKKNDYSYINLRSKYYKLIKNIFKKNHLKSKLISIDRSNLDFLLKKINNKYFKSNGNIENLSFAYKIAKNLGIKDKTIIKAINEFKGLSHRQEIIFSSKKLLCVNDSKATSFDASLQSLLNYNKIYWIVGGIPKDKDKFNLKSVKKKIVRAYIIGKNAAFFKKQLKNKVFYSVSKNLKNAINDIYKDIRLDKNSQSTILLSPAGASFDQFDNFEKRGSFFKKLIQKKLKKPNVYF